MKDPSPRNPGWCTCCRSETVFVEDADWLRDHYRCTRCQSLPRNRNINFILDSYFPGWEQLTMHESSPSNDYISRHARGYSASQRFEGVPRGSVIDGVRSEDIETLTFADESFDVFITQDVLEHVFRPDLAMREILRVLKPGGAHVFTAPKHRGWRISRPRAVLTNGQIAYLHPAEYHGNPIGDGKALVTWDYADDFELRLWEWCGMPTVTYVTRDRALGLDGEYLEVFVTRKIDQRA